MYNQFNKVVNLTVNQRVKGNNKEQSNFIPLLNRDCSRDSTEADKVPLKTCQMFTNLRNLP